MDKLAKALNKCLSRLCDKLIVNQKLLNAFISSKLLSEDITQSILNNYQQGTPFNRADALVGYLRKKRDQDYGNILEILRQNDNESAAEILETSWNDLGYSKPAKALSEPDPDPITSLEAGGIDVVDDDNSSKSLESLIKSYPAQDKKNGTGFALIINMKKKRLGCEFDQRDLDEVLQRCNYKVTHSTDKGKEGIEKDIQNFQIRCSDLADVGKLSSVMVIVMAHGTSGIAGRKTVEKEQKKEYKYFVTGNGKTMHYQDDLIEKFNQEKCDFLYKKGEEIPKIFIINICRGNNIEPPTDSFNTNPEFIETLDMALKNHGIVCSLRSTLICFSTSRGVVSCRPKDGALFIQQFCATLKAFANGKNNIYDLLNHTIQEIQEKKYKIEKDSYTAITPECRYIGFEKRFYLTYDETITLVPYQP